MFGLLTDADVHMGSCNISFTCFLVSGVAVAVSVKEALNVLSFGMWFLWWYELKLN